MLSGIGPAAELKKFNIKLVAELKGVGANLIDHPVVDLLFAERHGLSNKFIKPTTLQDVGTAVKAITRYFYDGKGAFATNVCHLPVTSFMADLCYDIFSFVKLHALFAAMINQYSPLIDSRPRSRTVRQDQMDQISRFCPLRWRIKTTVMWFYRTFIPSRCTSSYYGSYLV